MHKRYKMFMTESNGRIVGGLSALICKKKRIKCTAGSAKSKRKYRLSVTLTRSTLRIVNSLVFINESIPSVGKEALHHGVGISVGNAATHLGFSLVLFQRRIVSSFSKTSHRIIVFGSITRENS